MLSGKKVYIVGAGLGGVAFGLSLLKLCKEHDIQPVPEVHLFERDGSEDAQTGHGYSLGVRSDSGGLQVLPVQPDQARLKNATRKGNVLTSLQVQQLDSCNNACTPVHTRLGLFRD